MVWTNEYVYQYIFVGDDGKYIKYNNLNLKKNASKLIYPFADGKYELKSLKDESGIFYLIHPNEDYFLRNPETLEIISKDKKQNYFNKIVKYFKFAKSTGIVNSKGLLTDYGNLLNNVVDFLELTDDSIDFAKIILDSYSFNICENSEIFRNIIMFVVFKISQLNFKTPNYLTGNSDYLIIYGLINLNLFDKINIENIFDELDSELKNYNEIIEKQVNKLISNNYSNVYYDGNYTQTPFKITNTNINEIKKILVTYYQIKLKIELINLNSKFLLKKEFVDIFNLILDQKNKKDKISNEYLLVVDKLLLYYIDSDKFMKKNKIKEFEENLSKISETNISKKKANIIQKKINKLLNSSSLFKNDNLVLINLSANKEYSTEFLNIYSRLSNYDRLSFIIAKNFTQSILIKVPFTEFYINYYDKDINSIYSLEKILNKYTKTKVPEDIRNYFIFSVIENDNYELNNIFVLSENVIN